jgi:hypothetical protein
MKQSRAAPAPGRGKAERVASFSALRNLSIEEAANSTIASPYAFSTI